MVKNPADVVLALGRAHVFSYILRFPNPLWACEWVFLSTQLFFHVGGVLSRIKIFFQQWVVANSVSNYQVFFYPHWLSIPIYWKKWNFVDKVA